MSELKIYSVSLAKVQLNVDKTTGETNAVAYAITDELPFDCYGLYGTDEEGCSHHLADFESWKDARLRQADCVAALNSRGGVGSYVEYKDLLWIANR